MPRPYRGIILDADNTLFDFSRSQRESLEAVLADQPDYGKRAHAPFEAANRTVWEQYERGNITSEKLRVKRFELLFAELGISRDPDAAARSYLNVLSTKTHMLPGALKLLQSLSARFPLVLGTNGLAAVQRARIERSGIAPYLAGVIISEEIGTPKPDRAFFDTCLSVLGVQPARAMMVGDSPSSDIRGAREACIDACWYNPAGREYPPGEPRPTWTVRTLSQIEAIVE
jgi:YjjG family noncanonical pyrimidine nucleotidase